MTNERPWWLDVGTCPPMPQLQSSMIGLPSFVRFRGLRVMTVYIVFPRTVLLERLVMNSGFDVHWIRVDNRYDQIFGSVPSEFFNLSHPLYERASPTFRVTAERVAVTVQRRPASFEPKLFLSRVRRRCRFRMDKISKGPSRKALVPVAAVVWM